MTRLPIATVLNRLEEWGQSFAKAGAGLWVRDSAAGRTEIEVRSVTASPGRRQLNEVVTVRHLMADERWNLSAERLTVWNRYAGLSAAVFSDEHHPPMLFTRVSIYEGDGLAVNELHGALLTLSAYLLPGPATFLQNGEPGFVSFLQGAPGPGPRWFGLEEPTAVATATGSVYFASAADDMRRRGLYANASLTGVAVEYPWDAGATSWAWSVLGAGTEESPGARTALLTVTSDQPHPLFGYRHVVSTPTPNHHTRREEAC